MTLMVQLTNVFGVKRIYHDLRPLSIIRTIFYQMKFYRGGKFSGDLEQAILSSCLAQGESSCGFLFAAQKGFDGRIGCHLITYA
jgi:hypothetical protein